MVQALLKSQKLCDSLNTQNQINCHLKISSFSNINNLYIKRIDMRCTLHITKTKCKYRLHEVITIVGKNLYNPYRSNLYLNKYLKYNKLKILLECNIINQLPKQTLKKLVLLNIIELIQPPGTKNQETKFAN